MAYKDLEKKRANNRERQRRYQARLVARALVSSVLVAVSEKAVDRSNPVALPEERKYELTQILRHPIETPVTASHKIAAIEELNKMDHIYEPGGNIRDVNVVFVIGKGYVDRKQIEEGRSAIQITGAEAQLPEGADEEEEGRSNIGSNK